MTQAIKFVYNVDGRNGQDEISGTPPLDWTQNQWGNGPYFSNWSSYRNWLPGSAVVGMDENSLFDTSLNTWRITGHRYENSSAGDSPFFAYNSQNNGSFPQTWNGNFIDAGFYVNEAGLTGNVFPTFGYRDADSVRGLVKNPGAITEDGNSIHGMFDAVLMNTVISRKLFWNDFVATDREYFMSRIRSYYSIYLGQTMSRARNMMWRMTPALYRNRVGSIPTGIDPTVQNNTFVLEVMFDVPIMHTDHDFGSGNFSPWLPEASESVKPYQLLTVSGQGIIRYAPTFKTTLPTP